MLSFRLRAISISLLFLFTIPSFAQEPLSIQIDESYGWELDGGSGDQWPELIGHGEDYILINWQQFKS
ncbi:MAG: hypothetical protein HWE14_09910 [Flavobacteriia bacterium]|nr:hypothetical protein [Flavobacteriia bacterium]